MMKTESVMLQNLCLPCRCRCRYCLLSWDGKANGVDEARGQKAARAFFDWMRANRPKIRFDYSFGYCMEHPHLSQAIAFLREIGSPGAKFLQMDGMAMRDEAEAAALMGTIAGAGVESLNFTFYGLPDYHDRFAGREGDFDLMLRMVRPALKNGLSVSARIPLTCENVGQAEALVALLQNEGVRQTTLFVPHGEGRGEALNPVRFSDGAYALLPEALRPLLNRQFYRSEADWLAAGALEPESRRALILSLTKENLERIERGEYAALIEEAEALDEAYYGALPTFRELAALYGDAHGDRWYGRRDLFHHYQRQYIRRHGLQLYDVTDERQTGSRRY